MEEALNSIKEFASENLVHYGYNILAALVIFIVGKALAKQVSGLLKKTAARKLDPIVANFMGNILNVTLLAFVVIAALDQLGVETTSIVAILGAAGLAVGLALKDSLGNFAAGVMVIIFRPFKVGDYVEAGGAAGVVKEVHIFSSVFNTPDNKTVIVPNGAIMAGVITNYSTMPTRRVDMVIGVGYSSDLSKVKDIISGILAEDDRVLKDPAPVVAVSELADSSINLVVRPWVNSADYWAVMWDTTEKVKKAFDAAGIEIPFPQMDVHLHKQQD